MQAHGHVHSILVFTSLVAVPAVELLGHMEADVHFAREPAESSVLCGFVTTGPPVLEALVESR